jgi:putative transposase
MRRARLQGVSRRRFVPTTVRDRDRRPAPDLIERVFTVPGPNELWIADITYIPTWAGFLYLAVVLDAWSRKVVGWSMATHLRTALVLDALNVAIAQRRPKAVIHHSDQGCQYTSIAFGLRCREANVRPSMGSVGDAYDNAMAETIIGLFKTEVIERRGPWRSFDTVEYATLNWVDWFNGRRILEPLGYLPPFEFEQMYYRHEHPVAVAGLT